MNEFEEKDYEAARGYADSVKSNADNIMSIFDSIDSSMKSLYGDSWLSSGADVSNGRYQEIRKSYEVFYNNVVTMRNHIYTVTAKNEEADASVSGNISTV